MNVLLQKELSDSKFQILTYETPRTAGQMMVVKSRLHLLPKKSYPVWIHAVKNA